VGDLSRIKLRKNNVDWSTKEGSVLLQYACVIAENKEISKLSEQLELSHCTCIIGKIIPYAKKLSHG